MSSPFRWATESLRRLRKGLPARRRASEIDEALEAVRERQAKIRQHVKDTNDNIRRGVRPAGKKFRL